MHRLPRRAVMTATAGAIVALPLLGGPAPALAGEQRNILTFEVTASGDCSGVTFTGASGVPGSEFVEVELADPDGDGVFTGEQSLDPADVDQVVQIRADGEVIEDFGTINVEGGMTARASFECAGGGGTDDGDGADGGAGMPDTGGEESTAWAVTGGAAGLLAAAAGAFLLLRRRHPGR